MAARQKLFSLLLCLASAQPTAASLVVPRAADLQQAYLARRSFAEQQIPLNTGGYQSTEYFKAGEYTKHEQDGEICKTHGERQWAGTVDVTDQRRLFYWFFDSRNDPENDPIILWLNGGPGGSSMMGLFTEMGPCTVTKDSSDTVPNPHSWNNNASVLFIDQPAGTGFSSVTKGAPYPSTDEEAAVDLAFFFNTFFRQIFPDRAKLPLHIAGESYGGHYVPTFVDHVLADRVRKSRDAYNGNISSIILANAILDMSAPAVGTWELLCSNFRGQVFNKTICDKISTAMPECEQLGRDCRRTNDGYICLAARTYCEDAIESYYQAEEEAGNRSPYNSKSLRARSQICKAITDRLSVHLPCTNRPFCWDEMIGNYSTFISQPKALKALHFPPDFHFQAVNLDLNFQFALSNSQFKTRYPHMTRILESNIPVLVLNGNEDFIVNTPGQIWSYDSLPWAGQAEYRTAQWKTWGDGQGIWKQSKDKRLVFVGVDGAGHAAPGDQGELTFDIVRQWIAGWNTEY